jgi:hypothetical protein
MKVVIAGGRERNPSLADIQFAVDESRFSVTEVVCGECRGVDKAGAAWAESKNIPVKRFPANWTLFGRRAGPVRNAEMADYADAAILFPGGDGTISMMNCVLKRKKQLELAVMMTKQQAKGILRLEDHYSQRALAEAICALAPDLVTSMWWEDKNAYGNQLFGHECVKTARRLLGKHEA